ncbi:MAG: AraC family transcriptional regulator [Clostridiales bacterium]|nr:AraC family transcriptional regulator [Clostridiales bacterium]
MRDIYYIVTDNIIFNYQTSTEDVGLKRHYPHTHDFCELYFIVEGNCSYMVENGVFDMPYGTVIFTRPGELHSVIINEPCEYTRFYYALPLNLLSEIGGEHMRCFMNRPFGKRNSLILSSDAIDRCKSRAEHAVTLIERGAPDIKSIILADLLQTLHDVNMRFDEPDNTVSGLRQNTMISDALAYINEHLSEIRSTAEIASALYVSREYLSRSFTRCIGVTLTKYITKKRIECAKNLLMSGKTPIDVCAECGFGDYSYFIQIFRREVGTTPFDFAQHIEKRRLAYSTPPRELK